MTEDAWKDPREGDTRRLTDESFIIMCSECKERIIEFENERIK
ncbi:hypothetical protein EAG_04760 [Camponotus floridanus]|uniref:Uncharacterized protein n=1 Tax=Camponotus floridanus TaxID=104421 RepID=E2A9F8_CAMFO|nr:hypothetical protein EAG_04760 [Camponotus floridanus]